MKRLLLLALLFAGCEEQTGPVVATRRQPVPETIVQTASDPNALIVPQRSPSAKTEEEEFAGPAPEPASDVLIASPPRPSLTSAGHNLIIEFETGGKSGYDSHLEWPHGASGITGGIGYDFGYATPSVIESDWEALSDITLARIKRVAGLTGERAHAALPSVRDIMIEWGLAVDVFDDVDVARWFAATRRALPGFDAIRPNAQAALVSLMFNRGTSMIGSRRVEMRAIRDLVPERDYEGIAAQLRKMKHLWVGASIQNGMFRRREAEAKLVLTP